VLPAAALRSSGLEIGGAGSGSIPPRDVLLDACRQIMDRASRGELTVETERVPLAGIEEAWQRTDQRDRLAVIP